MSQSKGMHDHSTKAVYIIKQNLNNQLTAVQLWQVWQVHAFWHFATQEAEHTIVSMRCCKALSVVQVW